MARRRTRKVLETRAPRKGTLIAAAALYVVGLFGYVGFFRLDRDLAVAALAIAGGLLLLGTLWRNL